MNAELKRLNVMTRDDYFDELLKMKNGGAKHRALVDYLQRTNHKGFDISDDASMVCAFFNNGIIIISPYGIVRKFNLV